LHQRCSVPSGPSLPCFPAQVCSLVRRSTQQISEAPPGPQGVAREKAPRCGSEPPRPRYEIPQCATTLAPKAYHPCSVLWPFRPHQHPRLRNHHHSSTVLLLRASLLTYPLRLCDYSSADAPESNLSDQLQQTPFYTHPTPGSIALLPLFLKNNTTKPDLLSC
jgi:hypothetical protein